MQPAILGHLLFELSGAFLQKYFPVVALKLVRHRFGENVRIGLSDDFLVFNAKQLFETTMDPDSRQFLRVRLDEDNAVEADKMFDVLMGDIVEPRKWFIEDNALNVRNLDI